MSENLEPTEEFTPSHVGNFLGYQLGFEHPAEWKSRKSAPGRDS